MLLLVLQPLILYCVNNKLLAIKLNRHCVMFLKSSELYLSLTKKYHSDVFLLIINSRSQQIYIAVT